MVICATNALCVLRFGCRVRNLLLHNPNAFRERCNHQKWQHETHLLQFHVGKVQCLLSCRMQGLHNGTGIRMQRDTICETHIDTSTVCALGSVEAFVLL